MRNLLLLLACLCSIHGFSQADIEIYLETARNNNAELKSIEDQYMAAMEQIPQVQALADPQVSLGIFLQSVETRLGPQRASLALSQSFPWFGTLKARGNTAALMAETKLATYEDVRVRLYRDIRLTINKIYLVVRTYQLSEESLQILQSFKELARINFENGKAGFVDLLKLEMEEQELLISMESLRDQKKVLLVSLEQLLNAPLPKPLEFDLSLSLLNLPSNAGLIDSIKINNTKINTLTKMLEVKNSQVEVVDLMSKPSFTLGASYINIAERTDVDIPSNGKDALLLPQIGMKLPIFRKKYEAMEREIEYEIKGLEHQVENQENVITSMLEKYLVDITDAKRKVALYDDLTDLSLRARTLLETGFSTSDGDFEELITMERKLLSYKLELEKARVDHNNAIYQINYLLGR